jgi:AcrR family transcriptional regulator
MSTGVSNEVGGYRLGRVPKALREEQLRDVALALFAERGFDGTSIEDIRRAAGVSRPVFYDHFASKEAVYLACLRHAGGRLTASIVDAIDPQAAPVDQLRAGIEGYFAFVEKSTDQWKLLFWGSLISERIAAEEGARMRLATVSQIAALMSRTIADPDPDTVEAYASALAGAGEQLGNWWQRHPGAPRAEVVEHLFQFAWGGLERAGQAGA